MTAWMSVQCGFQEKFRQWSRTWGADYMKSTFCFSKDLQIILYGVNTYSEKLYESLTNAGYTVVACFDRRYEELNGKCPVPVYGLEKHPFANPDKTGFCVVIMLQNAMQHEMIAMELLRQGFHKVLFAPMKSRVEENAALTFRYQYNMLLSGQFQMLREIPFLEEAILQSEIDSVHSIIRDGKAFKIVWCPAELVYTNSARLCKTPESLRYADIPLYSLVPFVRMFEYLQGNREDPGRYLDEYGVNSCKYTNSLTDATVVLQRSELLSIYKNALNKGMDLFISSAPPAEFSAEHGVFNLLDGHHRSLFLVMQEFRYIPVRISQGDYEKWDRACKDTELRSYLDKGGKRFPILHPRYHKINEAADRNDLLQLESIQKYLSGDQSTGQLLKGIHVLDLTNTYGYYARNALRMGAESSAIYISAGEKLAQEVNALEGFPNIPAFHGWSETAHRTYHSLFVMKALMDMPPDEKKLWIDRCAEICQKECFAIARDSAELQLWSCRFSQVRELRTLFDRGKIVKLYVLQK